MAVSLRGDDRITCAIYLTVKDTGQRFGLRNLFLWMTLIAVVVATAVVHPLSS